MSTTCFEALFVDVGHGASNVILLQPAAGVRRAIVIDCGGNARPLLQILERRVDAVIHLVISHNDYDHWAGAPDVIACYRDTIDRITIVDDRPPKSNRLYEFLRAEFSDEELTKRLALGQLDQNRPVVLHSETVSGVKTEVSIIAPSASRNLQSQASGRPNATSIVVLAKAGNEAVLFSGDAEDEIWRDIHASRGGRELACAIATVPHHGGGGVDIGNVFLQAVRPRVCVLSVGTTSWTQFGIPRSQVVADIRAASCGVMCTQMTGQCASDLETARRTMLPLAEPGRSSATSDFTAQGNSKNVACAGTVVAQVLSTGTVIAKLQRHRAAVDSLASQPGGTPICRAF